MDKWHVDIAILMIFFNRPDRFSKVLNSIKIAKPRKLYLYQDGARDERDIEGISACRKLVEQINWDCEIYVKYQEKNYGCDPSVYLAIKWMFENENYGIIVEDDVVIHPTFVRFAKEMLDKFANDSRINMVCSMNHLKNNVYCNESYFFAMESPIWGWATWKRVVEQWNNNYDFLNDKQTMFLLKNSIIDKSMINLCKRYSKIDNYYFETITWKQKWLNNQLSIIPKKNMVSNIGVGGDKSSHYGESVKLLPRRKQQIMFMQTYEMEFPLVHPQNIIRDYSYEKKVGKIMRPCFFIKCCRGIEKIIRKILFKLRILK